MKRLGISIPERCNPADFLIEYVSGDDADENIANLLRLMPERLTIDIHRERSDSFLPQQGVDTDVI